MCFAGLWDVVKYDDSEDKNYTFTIITTDPNKQLKFLHDRMPVIFNPGSDEIKTWLDPNKYEWSKELQSLLKPFEGELEIYPVNKEVGKVGNDSASYIIPIDSAENKSNIANFFNKSGKKSSNEMKMDAGNDIKKEGDISLSPSSIKVKSEVIPNENSETNAPLLLSPSAETTGVKRELGDGDTADGEPALKVAKHSQPSTPSRSKAGRKMHSATNNGSPSKSNSPTKNANGSQKITSFFTKQRG